MINDKRAPGEDEGPNDNENLDDDASTSGTSAGNENSTRANDGASNCTELGNAQRLVHRFGRNLHYCPDQRKWLIWDGVCWRPDSAGEVEVLAKKIPRLVLKEALIATDSKSRKQLLRWSTASESAYRIRSAIDLARSEPGISIAAAELDPDPMLLAVKNGVVDLQSGKMIPALRGSTHYKTGRHRI